MQEKPEGKTVEWEEDEGREKQAALPQRCACATR